MRHLLFEEDELRHIEDASGLRLRVTDIRRNWPRASVDKRVMRGVESDGHLPSPALESVRLCHAASALSPIQHLARSPRGAQRASRADTIPSV